MGRKPLFSTLATLAAIATWASCSTELEAPEANPEIRSKQAAPAAAETPGSKDAAARGDAAKPAAETGAKLPTIDGFKSFEFGMPLDEAKKSKALRKRCKDKLSSLTYDGKYEGQKLRKRSLYCTAEIAGRLAELELLFGHKRELFAVKFSFQDPEFGSRGAAGKRRQLLPDEIDSFAADVRAVLDEKLGEPEDHSRQGLASKTVSLEWDGRTSDEPPHRAAVRLYLSVGLTSVQHVEWIDLDREQALEAAIEQEKNERVRNKGL